MSYVYVALTILLTVYGQLVIKWQVLQAGVFPGGWSARILFLTQLLLKPWVISAFMAAFMASLTWMAAMTKLQLSHAYPFMSLAFVLVLIFSGFFFNEPVSVPKIVGILFIVLGIVIGSQG